MASTARELPKWGWPCAVKDACDETCGGGHLYGVDWEACPIDEARKSKRLRILRGFQRQKRVCGTLDARDLPAWVLRDLDALTQSEA